MLPNESERLTAAFDVDRLPPGRTGAAGVQLRRCIDSGKIEIDHDDVSYTVLGERPGCAGADDSAADAQDVGA